MGGNISIDDARRDPVLGEMVRIIETPCENKDCACCKELRKQQEEEAEKKTDL